jgi:hypothetical protein
MEITATVEPSLWAVRLHATGATGAVEWTRRSPGGVDTIVGTWDLVWDYGPELNRPYTYIATDDTSAEVSQTVTVTADRPVLASTTSPIAYPVTVVEYRPLRGEGVTRWHPVLGRSDPFVTIHPALYPSGLLRLLAPDHTTRIQLWQLLEGGEPLLLRTTCADRVDSMTFVATSWEDPFLGAAARSGPATIDIDFQRITEVPGIAPPIPDRTWQTILDGHTTWQDVLGSYKDWRAVLDGAG